MQLLAQRPIANDWHQPPRDCVESPSTQNQPDSTGTTGLIRAVEEVFPNSLRQRCLAYKTRNVTDKVPDSMQAEIKKAARATYYVPNREVANRIAAEVLKTYQQLVFATLWQASQR